MPIILKTCTQCKVPQPIDNFPPDKRNPDGKQAKCRTCRAANQRDYAKRNPDKKRESDKRYREENREYLSAKKSEYNRNNRERNNILNAIWRRLNRERRNEIVREYRHRSPESAQAARQRHLARKGGADGRFETGDWISILNRYAPDGRCPACGEVAPLTIDHIIPLSRGGTNSPDNLQPLCNRCNAKKGTKTVDYRR